MFLVCVGVLAIEEVKQLANSFGKIEYKTAILLLFDSGFRIQELLTTKKRDLLWENFTEGEKCFWLQCTESKTERRKIPVTLFTEDLQQFCNTPYYRSLQDNDLLFQFHYETFLKSLKRTANKLFKGADGKPKFKVTPHALRHSSATFYAQKLDGNMQLLAQRYGWSFSSKELSTYIRRSGTYHKEAAKKVFSNEVEELRAENRKLINRLEKLEDGVKDLLKLKPLIQAQIKKTIGRR